MMSKHFKILEFSLSGFWRRRYKNFSIVAVFSFTIGVLASILFLTQALKMEAKQILSRAPELIVQKTSAGRHEPIPLEYAVIISDIPGVGSVAPRYWGYYYDSLTHSNYTLISTDPEGNIPLLAGEMPREDWQAAIGRGVSESRQVEMGDDIVFIDSNNIGTSFQISGIFEAQSNILANDLIVMTPSALKQFFGMADRRATDLTVQVYNKNEVNTVAGKIKQQLPDTRPITRDELLRTYDAVFNWRSGMMLALFSSALIAFCVLAWDKATGISGEEMREIATLKAIGWDTGDVLELKFWEGLMISLTSFLLGLLFAFVHVFVFDASLLMPMLKGWSIMFPDFNIVPYTDMYQIFIIGFLTVIPYICCTIVPTWKTAVTDPENVMRG